MKKTVCCASLLCASWLCFALTPLFAQSVAGVLQKMQLHQKDLRASKEQAKKLQRIGTVNCLDRKLKLASRLRDMAHSNYKKLTDPNKSSNAKRLERQARINEAGGKVKALAMSMRDCWCGDESLDNTGISISINSKLVPLTELCRERNAGGLVTLEIPQERDVAFIDEDNTEDLQNNFGFPEVPAASPFR